MSETTTKRRILLGMPGYGKQTGGAGRAFWLASCDPRNDVSREYQNGSLLACNFNKLWCTALNAVHTGQQLDYFAMIHDDVAAEDYWLDKLIEELEAKKLDVLGVVVPIKDTRGLSSIALQHEGDNWEVECRLSMHDIFELPETFTSDDLEGRKLLLNTGLWVCKWNQEWCRRVHFEINDRIVFDKPHNCYVPQVEPEDWFFSRLLNESELKIGATRKIAVKHTGDIDFANTHPWGSNAFDHESPIRQRKVSPVAGAFPWDIPGWLIREEGKALAELARGKRVLEIGSYCGLSTVCLARTADYVVAVDYFDGRGTPEPRETLLDFKANLKRYGVEHKVEICHPEADFPLPKYQLAFIDGSHEYEDVRRDIERACDVLTDDGLLAFHDYKKACFHGVPQAVDELLGEGGELISTIETLAVVKPPARILTEA